MAHSLFRKFFYKKYFFTYLYGVETREVNQAVKNNPEKFPAHYMFELTPSELRDLKSKVLISN